MFWRLSHLRLHARLAAELAARLKFYYASRDLLGLVSFFKVAIASHDSYFVIANLALQIGWYCANLRQSAFRF